MEHTILKVTWLPGALGGNLSGDLQFRMDHRRLVWDTFQLAQVDRELVAMFLSEPEWRWRAQPNLLDSLSDLPLTPTLAYALSLLGTEPLGSDTIGSLTGLPQIATARLVATLWALGGLTLVQGDLPLLPKAEAPLPPPPDLEFLLGPEFELEPAELQEPILLAQEDLVPSPGTTPKSVPRVPQSMYLEELESTGSAQTIEQTQPLSAPEEEDLPAPERARRLLVKAKSYLLQERSSEAIRALEQSLKLDGDSAGAFEAWMLLGRLRLSNPAWSTRAIEALQVASRLNPKAAEPWALMGELYHRKGFHANAQGCFRRALELDPSVAVPAGWSMKDPNVPSPKEGQSGLMGKLKGMFGRE
jgi:tetratricopeptide (TPR) repeat protein